MTHIRQQGFTLLEVLVALAILAITMAAVSRTSSSSIHHAEALRTRITADWVAQNRLALHQARGDWLPTGIQNGEEEQAGQTFPWREEIIATPNPSMRRIVIQVSDPSDANHTVREASAYLVQFPR
ncbi:MAG: type II secretion system minor pseudopilin GspI [Sideroxydans sp.]|nr:type II secretion system minor pseudopilin GspI [Sideroxydans sp.]